MQCPQCQADSEKYADSQFYPRMGLRAYTCRICGHVYSGIRDDDKECLKMLRRRFMAHMKSKGYDVSGLFRIAEPEKKIMVSVGNVRVRHSHT